MTQDFRPIEWPTGDLTERRAIFIYEVVWMQAAAVNAPVIPEPWSTREEAFKAQMRPIIEMMCGPDRKTSPKELHDDWVQAYVDMGWVYGPVRAPEAKTHPDMVEYEDLGWAEQVKDEVFQRLCEIARISIRDDEGAGL